MSWRRNLKLLCAACAFGPMFVLPVANACSPGPNEYTELPKRVAASGYLVEARIFRGYDIGKREPEVLQVDKIFVGEGRPRKFILARDEAFFDSRARGVQDTCSYAFSVPDERSRLYALFPAEMDPAHPNEERWHLAIFSSLATSPRGLEIVFLEAERIGRLRGRPPASGE